MTADDSDFALSTSSAIHSFAEDDRKANEEYERVQMLEVDKKRLEIEIDQLEREIAADNAESFSRDQLSNVKSELEHSCNELFAQRTNNLLIKLEEARTEKQVLERRAANLKRSLANEQKLAKQLVEERAAQRNRPAIQPPELTLPDISSLRESYAIAHRRRALEEEVRDAERQLAVRRQSMAENESRLAKLIQDSRSKSAQSESQIRAETLEVAQLEEMRSSLRERIEASRQRQKQLEYEQRLLESQVEAAEAAQRAKKEEIHRNFLAAQREFDELQARKKAEIRELTRQLHENEQLNRSKLQEKEQLIQEINARTNVKSEIPRKRPKKKKVGKEPWPGTVALQAEIDQLQAAKLDLMRKMQNLQRKAESNERKLEAVRAKLERKVAESERQVRKMRAVADGGSLPPDGLGSDESLSLSSH
jgi:hypothetical protein